MRKVPTDNKLLVNFTFQTIPYNGNYDGAGLAKLINSRTENEFLALFLLG